MADEPITIDSIEYNCKQLIQELKDEDYKAVKIHAWQIHNDVDEYIDKKEGEV